MARIREHQLNIRITEYEWKLIEERKKQAGSASMREFIVDAAINGYLLKVDYSDIKDLAYEINKIGTNINQIAHRVNRDNIVYKQDIEEVQDNIDLIWKMIRAKFYQIPI